MKQLVVSLVVGLTLLFTACAQQRYAPPEVKATTETAPKETSGSIPVAPSQTMPKPPSSHTVVFASPCGMIFGGYSNGKWLPRSEAELYCRQPMLFYKYNLLGLVTTVNSLGVKANEYGADYSFFFEQDMSDEQLDESHFDLDITCPKNPQQDYLATCLFSIGPAQLPDMRVLSDTETIRPTIQEMVDSYFGKGKAEAEIHMSIAVDIDSDGKEEIIVIAGNNEDLPDDSFWVEYDDLDDEEAARGYWYSIACIIESDGDVHVIAEDYENKYPEISAVLHLQNIIDINGNGKYEIVLTWDAYEIHGISIYHYDRGLLTGIVGGEVKYIKRALFKSLQPSL